MDQKSLAYYLERHFEGTLTPDERTVLLNMLQDPANAAELDRLSEEDLAGWERNPVAFPEGFARMKGALEAQMNSEPAQKAPRVHFLKTARWWAAAAVIAVVSTLAFFYLNGPREEMVKVADHTVEDILPGGNKAVLTLADGSTILLDSAANGTVARQGNASITKLANGEIAYAANGSSEEVLMNTLHTPRGGQYQLTLPDGTKAWLNAASAVTFPAQFAGNTRTVKITGEVYFEVTKDPSKPFIVDVDGKSKVEVLGTHFNINAYGDNNEIITTLVEGRVKVNTTVIQPGQRATIAAGPQPGNTPGIIVSDDPDVGQTLAWKNGLFSFNNADLPLVMKQLERWYDIEVRYEGKTAAITVSGEMFRNVKLSDVLEFLAESGLKFRMEGKTLIVL